MSEFLNFFGFFKLFCTNKVLFKGSPLFNQTSLQTTFALSVLEKKEQEKKLIDELLEIIVLNYTY